MSGDPIARPTGQSPPGMGGRRRHRWYGDLTRWQGPKGKVQIDSQLRHSYRDPVPLMLPEPVLRLAQAEYDRQFPGQPYERMQERGGLGLLEIIGLLADYVERIDPTASDDPEVRS